MSPVMYCPKCGQQNDENSFKCTRCLFVLQGLPSQNIVYADNTFGGLIPYKNAFALWSYYLGIFALIPCLGIPLGIAALITGKKGLKYAKEHPETKGKIHAWIGVVLGTLSLATNILVIWLSFFK